MHVHRTAGAGIFPKGALWQDLEVELVSWRDVKGQEDDSRPTVGAAKSRL